MFEKARYFNRTLALAAGLIAVSTFNYGFDNQAFSTTQAMDSFTRQFGVVDESTGKYALEPAWLSLFNSLNYIGFAAGVIIGSMVSSRWGRRWCMFVMSCYALVTATIAVTSNTKEQIMTARILNYIYVGMELAVVPIFHPCASPWTPSRHLSVFLGLRWLVINSICYGTSKLPDNRAWRIPLGMFYLVPSIVLSLIFFIPESPRWLLYKNRVDEARVMLQRLREGAFSDDEIENEFRELQFALNQENEQGRFIEIFQRRNLKRTFIVVLVNFFQQATGQAFASQYGAVYVRSLGTFNPVLFSLMNAGIIVVITIAILFQADRFGRRPLLMVSSIALTGVLMTMGGLGIEQPVSEARKKGIVAMVSLLVISFSIGWAPMTFVVATEVPALRLRDHSSRLGFGMNVLFNFLVNFSIQYLIYAPYAAWGSKVGFLFGSLAALALVFTFFCVPECKGKTLGQIDLLFSSGVKLRDFGNIDAESMMDAETNHLGGGGKGAIVTTKANHVEEGVQHDG
ncbi:general substrate transporter [Pseudomassariella vexata]|uniref:General substrate transporter n=1 Tax=Pseudomassariella vexata TaxID=1141098 RepID=A0A1Y2D5W8_9PEZI|nr:general substrate transporter [Pseudomassariella vexata]ORY54698.1 general substrate transporter [Pseudomassariella vexata]